MTYEEAMRRMLRAAYHVKNERDATPEADRIRSPLFCCGICFTIRTEALMELMSPDQEQAAKAHFYPKMDRLAAKYAKTLNIPAKFKEETDSGYVLWAKSLKQEGPMDQFFMRKVVQQDGPAHALEFAKAYDEERDKFLIFCINELGAEIQRLEQSEGRP